MICSNCASHSHWLKRDSSIFYSAKTKSFLLKGHRKLRRNVRHTDWPIQNIIKLALKRQHLHYEGERSDCVLCAFGNAVSVDKTLRQSCPSENECLWWVWVGWRGCHDVMWLRSSLQPLFPFELLNVTFLYKMHFFFPLQDNFAL